jgi:phosphomannomutase
MDIDPQIVAFDIDDTLTESKQPLDKEMADLLNELLKIKKVAIISGAAFEQINTQIIGHLPSSPLELSALYLLPTNGATLYTFDDGWKQVYSHELTLEEKQKVLNAFEVAFEETRLEQPEHIYGTLIEDRGAQITYSGLGSTAPIEEKQKWDPDHNKRNALRGVLVRELPEFSISMGGSTSIDITRKGVDKAYGLAELMKYLHISPEEMLYVGDAFFPGGNDSSVIGLGIKYASEDAPGLEDTKTTIRQLINKRV